MKRTAYFKRRDIAREAVIVFSLPPPCIHINVNGLKNIMKHLPRNIRFIRITTASFRKNLAPFKSLGFLRIRATSANVKNAREHIKLYLFIFLTRLGTVSRLENISKFSPANDDLRARRFRHSYYATPRARSRFCTRETTGGNVRRGA